MNTEGQISGQSPWQIPLQLSSNPNIIMDDYLARARRSVREKLFGILMKRSQPKSEQHRKKIILMAIRLEDSLFRMACSKEEYLNMNTLESRLGQLIRRNNQIPMLRVSSSPIGTMIPTPGMSHSGNSMAAASLDTVIVTSCGREDLAPIAVHTTSLMTSTSDVYGNSTDGYQESQGNFVEPGRSVSSVGHPGVVSRMIPTPNFKNNNNNDNNNVQFNTYSGPLANTTSSTYAESKLVSQSQWKKDCFGGQESHTVQNHDGLNGGMGMTKNNFQAGNASGTTEGYMTPISCGNSQKPVHQHFGPNHRGDGHGISNVGSFGSGNLCGPSTSNETMMNAHSSGMRNSKSISRTTSLANHKLTLTDARQAAVVTPPPENVNFQSIPSSSDNVVQPNPQLQLRPTSNKFILKQKQKTQPHQVMLKNDAFHPSDVHNSSNPFGCEPRMGIHDEALYPQTCEHSQTAEKENQLRDLGGAQNCFLLPGQDDGCHPQALTSPKMQPMVCSQETVPESRNGINSPSVGMQSGSVMLKQRNARLEDSALIKLKTSLEQHAKGNFQCRPSRLDEIEFNHLEESMHGEPVPTSRSSETQNSSFAGYHSRDANRDEQLIKHQTWLLLLRHAGQCKTPVGKCLETNCGRAQQLLRHMGTCKSTPCQYSLCQGTMKLVRHYNECNKADCAVCVPVKKYIQEQRMANMKVCPFSESGLQEKPDVFGNDLDRSFSKTPAGFDPSIDIQPSLKRMKKEPYPQLLRPKTESSAVMAPGVDVATEYVDVQKQDNRDDASFEYMDVAAEVPLSIKQGSPSNSEMKKVREDIDNEKPDTEFVVQNQKHDDENVEHNQKPKGECLFEDELYGKAEQDDIKIIKENVPTKPENATIQSKNAAATEAVVPKIKGVSLTEFFTPEQVREHVCGLKQWVGQSKVKAEKNQEMEHSVSENACQLCGAVKLSFEPPPLYCSSCGKRIKRNGKYYTGAAGEARHYFCIPCYNGNRGDSITVDGIRIAKVGLDKKKNDEETEESWVQCDKCESWQHQICALFNARRNDGGNAEYTCPNCYIAEIERGERIPMPQSAVLGARDLPRTKLSDYMEKRLSEKLKEERHERAMLQGKSYDEVPGAEALVIRVVSSVDKKLEVKPRIYEIFQEENYPTEFQYKSKVILLFQKIEGVEVCLFGMYVQEFGSECNFPNQRRVYLSYLDSVKYFRPDIKAVTGEALRTFVYHEILIGYLGYCKKRGFTSCYIWACPPLNGEDYILYCHPEIQKMPKSDKLREWYLSMLRKAEKDNIVVDLTNLYDHFFISTRECKAKITAARLPYFDGDYWPGVAEDLVDALSQEDIDQKQNKGRTTKTIPTKRALKASGQSVPSDNPSKDLLLMHKLGERIHPMKEDFIMVHLQHCCTHCCGFMVSGNRWVCNECKKFEICDTCYEAEQMREESERHPVNQKTKHMLYCVEVVDVPADTEDNDETLESEFFDTRQAFLSLCQGNHYQYDTLRRAKHSSMMVLYHLHNPTAPAFVVSCNVCFKDIEMGQGWRCEVCPDYDVCNQCHQAGVVHGHELTKHPSIADCDAQNQEARQKRILQLRRMLDLLVHSSQCRKSTCGSLSCRKVKQLFLHGMQCKIRLPGGCNLCYKMWYILQLHSRNCRTAECAVPRCRDLKQRSRRTQLQAESRRRAAVNEMMRQRAAEIATNTR